MKSKKILKMKKRCKREIKTLERLMRYAELKNFEKMREDIKLMILDRKLYLKYIRRKNLKIKINRK